MFAWYNLVGSFATAAGRAGGGLIAQALQRGGCGAARRYRAVVVGYALHRASCWSARFVRLSPAVEVPRDEPRRPPKPSWAARSRRTVFKLSPLFALDAFGGGFVIQSLIAYWFHLRFGARPGDARRDLPLRQPPGRRLGAGGRAARRGGSGC